MKIGNDFVTPRTKEEMEEYLRSSKCFYCKSIEWGETDFIKSRIDEETFELTVEVVCRNCLTSYMFTNRGYDK